MSYKFITVINSLATRNVIRLAELKDSYITISINGEVCFKLNESDLHYYILLFKMCAIARNNIIDRDPCFFK
jgi:hypothetical protein